MAVQVCIYGVKLTACTGSHFPSNHIYDSTLSRDSMVGKAMTAYAKELGFSFLFLQIDSPSCCGGRDDSSALRYASIES